LTYQWYFSGGIPIASGTNATLVIQNAQPYNYGTYWVVVGNYDGEVVSATANLKVATQLGYWPFDNTNTWTGTGGQVPLLFTNIVGVPSWHSNAMWMDQTGLATLEYRTVETNGNVNISPANGTIRFWFRPDWSSGVGPGQNGRMVELGNQGNTNGWWSIQFTADGTRLMFISQTNGLAATNCSAVINWTSNQWHQLVLTYGVTNSSLYVDGAYVAGGTGSAIQSNQAQLIPAFRIGGDTNGNNQAKGTFEDLETFNYPLLPWTITNSSPIQMQGQSQCISYPTQYKINSYPGISNLFTMPEPGLTNEVLTVSATLNLTAGSYTLTAGNSCNPTNLSGNSWYLVPSILWSAAMPGIGAWGNSGVVSNGAIISASLTNLPNFSISFVPGLPGNGYLAINTLAAGLVPNNPLYCTNPPVNPLTLPFSAYPPQRLTYLSFDNQDLTGDGGQVPNVSSNVTQVASPFGQGVLLDSSGTVSLAYPAFQSDAIAITEPDGSTNYSSGTPNIRRNEGTVRFWFKPDWTSGNGPTNGGIFLDMVGANWLLQVTNSGRTIELDAGTSPLLRQAIAWTNSTLWHQIALTYSSTGSVLFVDGAQSISGAAMPPLTNNPLTVFQIGSDGLNPTVQVRGIMDEVETFNYVLGAGDVSSNYTAMCSLDVNGDGISDLVEFEAGIISDPWAPPAQNPIQNPAPTPGDTNAPIIQLVQPINAQ
jgi:hypothetical protein